MRLGVRVLLMLVACALASPALAQPLPKLIPYRTKNGWGYCDSTRNLRIPAIYVEAERFRNGLARVRIVKGGDSSYALLREDGSYLVPPAYHWTARADRLNARDGSGRWGYVDTNNRLSIPFRYDRAAPLLYTAGLPQRFAIASENGRAGAVTEAGDILVLFAYDELRVLGSDGYYWNDSFHGWSVRRDNRRGLLHSNAAIWFPIHYDAIYPMIGTSYAAARAGRSMGVIDTAGRVIVPFRYDSVGNHSGNGVPVRRGEGWGWFNIHSGKSIPERWACCPTGSGKYILADSAVRIDVHNVHTWKLILDEQGRTLAHPVYENIWLAGDSVMVYRQGDDYDSAWQSRLDETTWTPLQWRRIKSRVFVRLLKFPRVGDQLYTDSAGRPISNFVRNGIEWSVVRDLQVRDLHYNTLRSAYILLGSDSARRSWSAVIDPRYRYIVPPQRRYLINGGDLAAGWFLARDGAAFVVIDSSLQLLAGPSPGALVNYFTWKGRRYLIGERRTQQEAPAMALSGQTVLDSRGRILKGFARYHNPRFWPDPDASGPGEAGIMHVMDNAGNAGFVRLDGRVLYPELSFAYPELEMLSERVFATREPGNSWPSLRDASGSRYLPKEKTYPVLGKWNGLYWIGIAAPGQSGQLENFYMDYRGVIYADADVFQ